MVRVPSSVHRGQLWTLILPRLQRTPAQLYAPLVQVPSVQTTEQTNRSSTNPLSHRRKHPGTVVRLSYWSDFCTHGTHGTIRPNQLSLCENKGKVTCPSPVQMLCTSRSIRYSNRLPVRESEGTAKLSASLARSLAHLPTDHTQRRIPQSDLLSLRQNPDRGIHPRIELAVVSQSLTRSTQRPTARLN